MTTYLHRDEPHLTDAQSGKGCCDFAQMDQTAFYDSYLLCPCTGSTLIQNRST